MTASVRCLADDMSLRAIYLLLALLGTVIPYLPFLHWLRATPLDAGLAGRFVHELFSTRIGAFFGLDVVLSAITLFVFIRSERSRLSGARVWPAVIGTLLVGVSLGLPLYLYERERALRKQSAV